MPQLISWVAIFLNRLALGVRRNTWPVCKNAMTRSSNFTGTLVVVSPAKHVTVSVSEVFALLSLCRTSRHAPQILLVRARIAQKGFAYLLRRRGIARSVLIEEISNRSFVVFPKACS